MSRQQNNVGWGGIIAGVAVGIGALAGIGYTLYDRYQQEQITNNLRRPSNNIERTSIGSDIDRCPVCDKHLSEEPVFGLPCDHKFHKNCIKANFVLHHDEEEFLCPINNCKKVVPEAVITRMFA